MGRSEQVLAIEARIQVDSRTTPLVGSLYRLVCAMPRAVAHTHTRSIPKQAACRPPSPLSSSEIQNPSSPIDDLLCQHHLNLVREADPPLRSICNWLEEGDVYVFGGYPLRAGGFTDLWRGSLDNRKVAIKSYRRYLSTDPSWIFLRFSREAQVCNRLLAHKNIVSFIGTYSTTKHPFSLVFDFAGHFDLKGYLWTHPKANRLELLVGIARGLNHMHDLDVVHGRLETVNVLVDLDGTARIAGLGSALIIGNTTPLSEEMSAEWLFRGSAPELMYPQEFGLSCPRNSKPGDVYAFGVLAWEVFTGRAMFSGNLDVVAAHTMWKGVRPPRPDCPGVTGQTWKMMKQCWERLPSKRPTIKEVARILEAERRAEFHGTR